ncbi:MAG: ribosome maturation factor RimP [Bryobacteraceae bacterium]
MRAVQNNELIDRISELCADATRSTGIEVADVQVRGAGKARLLRVFIDKAEGVTHADCEMVSQKLGQLLDEQDIMPEEGYTLEVSSLGAERKLSTERDFARVIGKAISMTVRSSPEKSEQLEGKLVSVHGGQLGIEVRDGEVLQISLERVLRAKLKLSW